ncbi:MAG TPA: hypothetical protein VGH93_12740 [Solirubrobacteraceae bacterium]
MYSDPAAAPLAIHFTIDDGPEQAVLTTGNPGVATIVVPPGSHSLQYWGEDTAGDLEDPNQADVIVDAGPPTGTIASNQDKTTYALNEPGSVTVDAADTGSGLQTDPSADAVPIATNVPGTFTIRRTAVDGCGHSTTASFTYSVVSPAAVNDLKIRPASFVAAVRGGAIARSAGTVLSYQDPQAATATFTVERAAPGRLRGGKCVKPTGARPRGKRCTHYVALGNFRHADNAGTNRFRFTGRVDHRKLPPGSYRLKAVARGTIGTPAPAVVAAFRILPS